MQVIDNEELVLTAEEFWARASRRCVLMPPDLERPEVALNYQLMHQLDFLPVASRPNISRLQHIYQGEGLVYLPPQKRGASLH